LLIENQTRFVYNTLEIKDYVFALANAKQIWSTKRDRICCVSLFFQSDYRSNLFYS
jgi:hypothetical protein